MKSDDLKSNPSSPLTCEAAMITDVADVNPTVTGIDIKSISTPETDLDYISIRGQAQLGFGFENNQFT